MGQELCSPLLQPLVSCVRLQGLCLLPHKAPWKAGCKNSFQQKPELLSTTQGHGSVTPLWHLTPFLPPPTPPPGFFCFRGAPWAQGLEVLLSWFCMKESTLVRTCRLPWLGKALTTLLFHFLFHTNKCVFPLLSFTLPPCNVNQLQSLPFQAKPWREK